MRHQPEWRRFLSRFRFYFLLLVGVVPAAVLGLLFDNWVDEVLGKVWIIAVNLVVGGVVMLFIDRLIKHNHAKEVTYPKSFVIGLFQTITYCFYQVCLARCRPSWEVWLWGLSVRWRRSLASFWLQSDHVGGFYPATD